MLLTVKDSILLEFFFKSLNRDRLSIPCRVQYLCLLKLFVDAIFSKSAVYF